MPHRIYKEIIYKQKYNINCNSRIDENKKKTEFKHDKSIEINVRALKNGTAKLKEICFVVYVNLIIITCICSIYNTLNNIYHLKIISLI